MGVVHHHNPSKADEKFQAYAYLTYLSEQAVFRLGVENGIASLSEIDCEEPSETLLGALEYFGLALETFDELIQTAQEQADSVGMA